MACDEVRPGPDSFESFAANRWGESDNWFWASSVPRLCAEELNP